MDIRTFSGGEEGIPPGACGLMTAFGQFELEAILKAAMCLQYRGRTGAGVTLKGVYPFKGNEYFHFHIMYRNPSLINELENVLTNMGFVLAKKTPLAEKKWYYEYDMPQLFYYQAITPDTEQMLYTDQIFDPMLYVRLKVTEFNTRYINDARIFSSSRHSGTYLTAFQLDDTLKIYDIYQYSDRQLTACQTHMRWPTSMGRGLWWGPQPIALGNVSGTHNGHLSSDRSNAIALEQLGIPLHVGTDSEAIFKLLHYLVSKNYSLKEIEWIVCRKFPQEANLLPEKEYQRYLELTNHPILNRFKLSGPTTAIVIIGDLLIGLTDRDHLRAFTVGYNEKVTLMGSEERAVVVAAHNIGENIEIFNPDAGKVIAFKIKNGVPERLSYEWKKTA